MIEIKFLKELPIRSLNIDKCPIKVVGADIYADKDGNRFAYIEFDNTLSQPMYSLYFVIKQYDSFGSFIKEVNFSLPAIYSKKGKYIIEKPVRLDQECDGVEIYISYAEFAHSVLFKDKLGKSSHLGLFVPNFYEGAPKEVSKSFIAGGQPVVHEQPSVQQQDVKPVTEETKVDEEVATVETSNQEKQEPKVQEEQSNTNNEEVVVETGDAVIKNIGFKFNFANLLIAVLAIVFILASIIVARNMITQFLNQLRNIN